MSEKSSRKRGLSARIRHAGSHFQPCNHFSFFFSRDCGKSLHLAFLTAFQAFGRRLLIIEVEDNTCLLLLMEWLRTRRWNRSERAAWRFNR
jgi:hypothetical protein